jgi:hypothetical protein
MDCSWTVVCKDEQNNMQLLQWTCSFSNLEKRECAPHQTRYPLWSNVFLYCPIMCLYVLSSCCDVRYFFCIKRCSVRFYLQLFVGGLMTYLRGNVALTKLVIHYGTRILFFEPRKQVLHLQGMWHSPNLLSTMVHGHDLYIGPLHTHFRVWVMVFVEDHTVTVKFRSRTAIKTLFLYLIVCLSVMLDSIHRHIYFQ